MCFCLRGLFSKHLLLLQFEGVRFDAGAAMGFLIAAWFCPVACDDLCFVGSAFNP